MNRRRFLQALGTGGLIGTAGCLSRSAPTAGTTSTPTVTDDPVLDFGATTTVHDSGLLHALLPGLEASFGVTVKPIIKGSGAMLRTAEDGDVDVVLVHARPLEDRFLEQGYGINRRAVMMNDFLVVGPADDPAEAAGRDPIRAIEAIARSEATFLSRGDRSGTHLRERQLWAEAGLDPGGRWYRETGQGMGETLIAARQLDAYTLSDRGTFLATDTGEALGPIVDRGLSNPPPLLENIYSAIATNPARHDVNYQYAMAAIGYLTGPAQDTIADFRIDGERTFQPIGSTVEPKFDQYVPADWTG